MQLAIPYLARFQALPQALQYSVVYALALGLSKGLSLLMVPVATHYLTPADYGRLDVLQTLADLLSIVIGMGLADTLYRYASCDQSPEQRRAVVANIFGMALCLGGLSLLITQVFATQINQLLPGDIGLWETRILLLCLSLGGCLLVPLTWLRIEDKAWLYLFGSAGRVLLQVLVSILLLTLGFGVMGVLLGTLCSSVLMASYLGYRQYRDSGIRFDFMRFRRYSVYGGPLIFVGIAGFVLGSFDRWILADSIGTARMAEYALAAKFGLITAVLIQPFDLWWQARRFSYLKQPDGASACAKFATIGVLIALLAALLISAIGPQLVRWLTPPSYHGAISYIPWLAALAALHNITSQLNLGAMTQSSTWRPAAVDCSAALIALLGYLWLIPSYQAWGAIAATSIALASRCLVTFFISQSIYRLPYASYRLLVMSAICLILIWAMPQQPLSLSSSAIIALLFFAFGLAAYSCNLLPRSQLAKLLQSRR